MRKIEVKKQYLNSHHRCRPGGSFSKTSITIHSTANPTSTAQNERNWLDNSSNNREASWHYIVDEKEVIQAIPDIEEAWHCGNSKGNRFSIGIEICESGSRKQTLERAAKLTAEKLKECNLNVDSLKRHYDWTEKNCPRILIDPLYIKDRLDWDWFVEQVKKYGKEEEEMEKEYNCLEEVPSYAKPTIKKLMDKAYLLGSDDGKLLLTDTMIRLLVILDRAKVYKN